ncbi:carbohydrate ABC transporter permease [Demequina sp. TTPB684]|uniref:carbohydrate ABC transporter permease n=1 Tax=unclassified Demequina TaxID=2620311 RepID=UPI001CF4EE21|nr:MULTISPECIES: carbohydrate ABC transporter permease [unclassified Demequina]MCB2411859.1 carbohydrate ABC transporter permease [Demequina sp. TTPB684]UPU88614.1 carbohydrate ABC transporter permease [Demequina sp. TMPB413]
MTTEIAPTRVSRGGTPDVEPHRPLISYRTRARISSTIKHAVLITFSVVMVYPLLWLIVSSFKPNEEIFRDLSIFTTNLTLENYVNGWNDLQHPFGVFLMNSGIISLAAIVGTLVSCSLAAYAFARLEFRFKTLLFAMMLATIMLPFQVVLVPQFTIFKELGWLNTFLPLIVPKMLAVDAFFIFLMVQFIRALPREIFEAARIDGAGHARTFLQVTLPLMIPAIATTAIFTFIWTWGDFFGPLIYLRLPETFPVSVALKGFIDAQSSSDFGSMFAMSVVSLIPLFIIFLVGQRYLIKGFATTGMK